MKYTLTKDAVQWIITKIKTHINDKNNPHAVNKNQIGLGNVDNTSDANKAVFESRLRWGGTNIAGDISPIDAAMSNIHSANRAAFANPAGIIVEFSNDGGSTWADYGASDTSKIQLVSGIDTAYFIGKHTTNNTVTVNDKLRITVNASNCGFYTALKKILIYVSTNGAGGAYVELQKSYKGTETSWSSSERYSISGWSGWNSIPCSGSFGGGSNQTGNMANIRLTFGITSKGSSSYINSLSVQALQFLGTTYWGYHSEMAKSGHLYSYDENQNATFPAQVTAERFNGIASRAMTDSDGKWINSTYIKGLSVSGRTITYTKGNGTTGTITTQDTNTTYGVATTSADGLMSKADKAKLDGIGTGSNVKSVNGKTGAVTLAKGDVGLGSVANLDQSKAIKSITRSGTTFTATALDGTTTTFTQQDTNTTYGVATTGANGLMSATDKARLDKLWAAMNGGLDYGTK